MSDPYASFHAARLVLALRQSGVMDQRIMEALEKTPREPFVPRPFVESAWDDIELPIDCGQNLTRPVVVGVMIQALDPKRENTVLEVGCGSGYSSAVLARLARRVYSLDRYRTLVDKARSALDQLGIERVELRHGDGLNGWPEAAPFDRLLLMGSVTEVSPVLAAQLAVGGIVVAPIDGGPVQIIVKLVKQADGTFTQTPIMRSGFTPLQAGVAREL
jgi:protein-L-isoaspartate(D-aspartate) O-methyltransferase